MNRPPRRGERGPWGDGSTAKGSGGRDRPVGGGGASRRVRPVYEAVQGVFAPRPAVTANTGLMYDRYADIWSGEPAWAPAGAEGGNGVRQQFLGEVVKHAERFAPRVATVLQALHERRAALWGALGARVVTVILGTPLVSGMGMLQALEVVFVWDRNLGIPYLPGTSLKGAARAWAEQGWGDLDESTVHRIFGTGAGEGKGDSAGTVIFHALYPVAPPRLRLDVLNPHFGEYYREGKLPTDSLTPNPVFFLTVAAGEAFRTALQLRPGAPVEDVGHAEACLRGALTTLGAGAKTAVGYGLFAPSGK